MRVPRLRWLLPASYLVLITGLAGPLGWITISADAEWEGPALRYAPWALLLIWSIIVIAGVKRYGKRGLWLLTGVPLALLLAILPVASDLECYPKRPPCPIEFEHVGPALPDARSEERRV